MEAANNSSGGCGRGLQMVGAGGGAGETSVNRRHDNGSGFDVPPLRVRDLSLSRVLTSESGVSKCKPLASQCDDRNRVLVAASRRSRVCVWWTGSRKFPKLHSCPKSMATNTTMQSYSPGSWGLEAKKRKGKRSGASRHIFLQSRQARRPLRRESRTRRQNDREQLAHAAGSRFALSKVDNPNPLG